MGLLKKIVLICLISSLIISVPTGIYIYNNRSRTPEQTVREYTKGLLKAYQSLKISDISKYVAMQQYYEDKNQLATLQRDKIKLAAKLKKQTLANKVITGSSATVEMSENWVFHFVNIETNQPAGADRETYYIISYQLKKNTIKGWQIIKSSAISYDLGTVKK